MDAGARTDPKGATRVASVEEHLEEARRLDLASTQGRFRLGDLTEALSRELPAVADLLGRLAIDLEVDRDTITESWFVAAAFPPATAAPACHGAPT
jgi:ketopantoate reductase